MEHRRGGGERESTLRLVLFAGDEQLFSYWMLMCMLCAGRGFYGRDAVNTYLLV